MKNTITLPTAPVVTPASQRMGTPAASKSAVTPEPEKATKADPLIQALSPAARKALQQRLPATKGGSAPEPPAPQGAAVTPTEPKPKETPTAASEDGQGNDTPDAGVIDFTQLGADVSTPDGEKAPTEPTDAELSDPMIAKKKIQEAHQENAKLRKQRREAQEAREKLEADHKALTAELEAARTQPTASPSGRYLDRFHEIDSVNAAKADAVETLRQLQEEPTREVITLPGNRQWKITDAEGNHLGMSAAQTAFDILDGHEAKVKEITQRGAAEKLVQDKLPALTKTIPDFETRYQKTLKSDWKAEAPKLSLHATLGELVTSGDYVLVPRGKATAKPAAAAKPAAQELPNTPPAPRAVSEGEVDTSELEKRARGGDQKALKKWIQMGTAKRGTAA